MAAFHQDPVPPVALSKRMTWGGLPPEALSSGFLRATDGASAGATTGAGSSSAPTSASDAGSPADGNGGDNWFESAWHTVGQTWTDFSNFVDDVCDAGDPVVWARQQAQAGLDELTGPLSELGPGDEVTLSAEGGITIPIRKGIPVSVSRESSVSVSCDADGGGYTISTATSSTLGVALGETVTAGADLEAGGVLEFHADTVEEAEAIAQTLIKLHAHAAADSAMLTAAVSPTGSGFVPLAVGGEFAVDVLLPVSSQELNQLTTHLSAIEVTGELAGSLGVEMGLPMPASSASLEASGAVSETLRVEFEDGQPSAVVLQRELTVSEEARLEILHGFAIDPPQTPGGAGPSQGIHLHPTQAPPVSEQGSVTVTEEVRVELNGDNGPSNPLTDPSSVQFVGEPTVSYTVADELCIGGGLLGTHAEVEISGLSVAESAHALDAILHGNFEEAGRQLGAHTQQDAYMFTSVSPGLQLEVAGVVNLQAQCEIRNVL